MEQLRDTIDFGKENIPILFRKMLIPTLMGMIFSAIFIITDGIFVGKGVGSGALAAINFISPLSLISMGLGMTFGIGASVVATIHLSSGKLKVARINITQASIVYSILVTLLSALLLLFPDALLHITGCSETLIPLSKLYLYGFAPFMLSNGFIMMAGFFVRLNGAPNYAMICSIVAAVINILLDYIFIFHLGMGIFGAAIATGIGTTVGVVMMIVYLVNPNTKVHYTKLKLSKKSMQLTLRNVGYMSKLGASGFLGLFSIACMVSCGNIVFMREMGDDGVAAYSIVGYITPLMLTLFSAIAQAMQPIISYNYGAGDYSRVRRTIHLALATALIYSIIPSVLIIFFSPEIASLFMSPSDPAYALVTRGLPLYSISLIPVAINIIAIGYFQSMEEPRCANIITIFRGYIFMIGCYAVVPLIFGSTGAWLSTPLAEVLTMIIVAIIYLRRRRTRLY